MQNHDKLPASYFVCKYTYITPSVIPRFGTGPGSILGPWGSGDGGKSCIQKVGTCTPPKFNMEPEKKSLEKEVPLGNHHFQVPC